jgi:hypothetical protein
MTYSPSKHSLPSSSQKQADEPQTHLPVLYSESSGYGLYPFPSTRSCKYARKLNGVTSGQSFVALRYPSPFATSGMLSPRTNLLYRYSSSYNIIRCIGCSGSAMRCSFVAAMYAWSWVLVILFNQPSLRGCGKGRYRTSWGSIFSPLISFTKIYLFGS